MDSSRLTIQGLARTLETRLAGHHRIDDTIDETEALLKDAARIQTVSYGTEANPALKEQFQDRASISEHCTSSKRSSRWTRILPKPSKAVLQSQKAAEMTPELRQDPMVEAMKYGSVLRV